MGRSARGFDKTVVAAIPMARACARRGDWPAGKMRVLGALIGAALASVAAADAKAKTPGTVHCYGKLCHRIHGVEETDGMVGRRGMVKASYYDDCKRDRFNPCGLTSSGAVFRPDLPDNAASPIFPDGTILLTYNPETRLAAVVRVNSAGPYRGDRTLDVSRATAEHLGFRDKGVASLEVAVLKAPEPHEARYKKLRTYAPVPGFLGKFATFDDAHDAALAELDLDGPAPPESLPIAGTAPRLDIDSLWPRGLAMDTREVRLSERDRVSALDAGDALPPTVRDRGPDKTVGSRDIASTDLSADAAGNASGSSNGDGIDARPADTSVSSVPSSLPSWGRWLADFLEQAREKARLRRVMPDGQASLDHLT